MTMRYAAFAFLILALLSQYFGLKYEEVTEDVAELAIHFQEKLSQDSITIQKYFRGDYDKQVLKPLESSPFYVEVYRLDSIVFWNDNTQMVDNPISEIVFITRWGDTSNYALVYFNLNQTEYHDKKLNQWHYTEYNPNVAGYDVKIVNTPMTIEDTAGLKKSILWKVVSWLSLFGCVILSSINLMARIKSSLRKNKVIPVGFLMWLLLIVGGFYSVHYIPQFYHYFSGMSIENLMGINIYQMVSGLWILGVLLYVVESTVHTTGWWTNRSVLAGWLVGFYTFLIFGISIRIIEMWVLRSDVNLEIESLLQFNYISFLVIISLLILMVIVFHSTQLLFEWLHGLRLKGYYKASIMIAGWMCAYLLLRVIGWLNVPVWLFFGFISAYSLILDAYTEKKEKKITYLIWWMMLFAGYLAITLFYFGLDKDIRLRNNFMVTYFNEYDPIVVADFEKLNENLLTGDVFSKIASMDPDAMLDHKDLNEFISTYADTSLLITTELFNKQTGTTLFSNHYSDYYKLNQSYIHSRLVGKNIYHHPFENKYYSRFEIAGSVAGATSWYLFIIYQAHKKSSTGIRQHTDFGYIVLHRNQVLEKRENNQSMPDLQLLRSLTGNEIKGGYSFVVSKPADHFTIVSWKKVSGLIKPISLFSFVFTMIGLIVIIFTWINTKYDFLPENLNVKFGSRSSLKTKIQFAIILLIVVTFLIIGVITAIYFKNLIVANQKAKNAQETETIINNINSIIQNFDDDVFGLNYINSKLKDLSNIHNKDLSLYDKSGKLVGATSDDHNHIRIPYDIWMNPDAEQPENHQFVPLYVGENKTSRRNPFAFIDIDHQSYNTSSNILDFLSTILNAYIFLFLIAGAIAIAIANSITQPLSILAEKLKKFKLGKTNELLEWNSNDEIGELIHDYNNLTLEMEKSAGLLAKTERDMAWREMAKQVAHEIKNPLTPMKLNIQYLEKTAKDYPDRTQELIPKVSAVLVEQIDNLSQIANEFSNFAAMPQASNEKIILNEVVETIHDLFRKRDDMDINMMEPIDDLYVFADKNHLVRILNNLLKNAIQAIPDSRRGKINIELSRKNGDAIIRISDNGVGIPDHMKDKVFTPNFTTKSSGTGLGLAISANMIDSFNGRIYFETIPGTGTDFYVSIPLMRTDDSTKRETRVTLDE